jgi:alkylhydroperoxidase/carboxymuconolactone decarboxylase family protein YurZ
MSDAPDSTERRRKGLEVYASQFGCAPEEARVLFETQFGSAFADEAFEASGGRVWQEGPLSMRERSLIVIAILATLGGVQERLSGHVTWAIDNGASVDDIEAAILMVSNYAGYPRSSVAMETARQAISEKDSHR